MKRIISLMAVIAIMFSFSVTVNAATATMTVENASLKVMEGTQDVVINVNFELDEATSLYGVNFVFELPTGVTFKSADFSAVAALLPDADTQTGADFAYYFDANVEGSAAVESLTVPFTFTVDTTVAAEYAIAFTGSTGICDIETYEPVNDIENLPTATITVEAAGPKYEDVTADEIGEAIAADTTTVDTYENYAIYAHSFEAPAGADVKSVNALGFKVSDHDDVTFSAAITGAVKYIVAYVGEGADTAVVKPFYNVTRTVEVK